MNETVLHLAVRTAIALKNIHQKKAEQQEVSPVSKYFSRMGVNPEDIEQVYDNHFNGRLIDDLCHEINNTLQFDQKIYLLLLVQDSLLGLQHLPDFYDRLLEIYRCIGIDSSLIQRFNKFLEYDDPLEVDDHDYLLLSPRSASDAEMLEGKWIEDNKPHIISEGNRIEIDEFDTHMLVMFVDQIKSYVVRCFKVSGRLFDQDLEQQCRFRLLGPGGELSVNGVPVLTFSGLKNRFLQSVARAELTLRIDNIQYHRSRGNRNLAPFSALETTGQLIGIVGREGVGKSTLLKLLAGKIKPDSGTISINGYGLWKNKYLLKGVIGYVPEEDLLFEELTVGDNLALTARLFYSTLSRKEIDLKVNSILSKLDLLELKHEVAGEVLSKHIQPGQRRMINIALELLREPQILLVDNALSGLGMSDASKVIKVLHDYSFSGNLVITTISQADSSTFLYFDKIWIFDQGGRAVYNGTVKAAPEYLNSSLRLTDQEMSNVDPSRLLDLVNYKLPEREGQVWKRVMEPEAWHQAFMGHQVPEKNDRQAKAILPARILKIPNLEIQLLIFSIRNFKCKFSRIKDIIRVLLTGPVIALLVSLLLRYSNQQEYIFQYNTSLPAYQFISVIISLFLGLVLSSDEIFRERNVLEKEDYLEFSRFSYLNSKILYLFPVVALQTFLYLTVGNYIIGIRELFWVYWIVLFSSSCFGVLLGLSFSSGVHRLNALYKGFIPLVITVQVLLGGGFISYEKLNLGKGKYTPVLADFITARWGYEALAVEQYKSNSYEKLLYMADKKLDQASFHALQVIPRLESVLGRCENPEFRDSLQHYSALLQNELVKIAADTNIFPFEYISNLPDILTKPDLIGETRDYLTYLNVYYYDQYERADAEKNTLLSQLNDSIGSENLVALKKKYYNDAVESAVLNSTTQKDYSIIGNDIIRTSGAVYQDPVSNFGRARMFSPVKMINERKSETLWFNISMIWLLSAVCYLFVLFDVSRFFRRAFQPKVLN